MNQHLSLLETSDLEAVWVELVAIGSNCWPHRHLLPKDDIYIKVGNALVTAIPEHIIARQLGETTSDQATYMRRLVMRLRNGLVRFQPSAPDSEGDNSFHHRLERMLVNSGIKPENVLPAACAVIRAAFSAVEAAAEAEIALQKNLEAVLVHAPRPALQPKKEKK